MATAPTKGSSSSSSQKGLQGRLYDLRNIRRTELGGSRRRSKRGLQSEDRRLLKAPCSGDTCVHTPRFTAGAVVSEIVRIAARDPTSSATALATTASNLLNCGPTAVAAQNSSCLRRKAVQKMNPAAASIAVED